MSLDHEFFLLNKNQYPLDEEIYRSTLSMMSNRVLLHDDFIRYIGDTLVWIPTYNPSKQEKSSGLNLYGLTVINQEGAGCLKNIVDAWVNLVSQAPTDDFILTGNYIIDDGKGLGGFYERRRYSKKTIRSSLLAIQQMAQVVSTNKACYILHWGI